MIERHHPDLSVERQCTLLNVNRSTLYYRPRPGGTPSGDEPLMRRIDQVFTDMPDYGVRRMTAQLRRDGHPVGPKRVGRLMREMGLEAIYPKPKTSKPNPENRVFPSLLRGVAAARPNQVWSTDITYIPLRRGHAYLVAVMDWYSRYVLSWEVSMSLEAGFCLEALEAALRRGRPEIFNTDQGAQFTSLAFTGRLEEAGVRVSMDGRGRALDNVFVERLWRSVKYEEVFLRDYADGREASESLGRYFRRYNEVRLHSSLGYVPPAEAHFGAGHMAEQMDMGVKG